MVDTVSAVRLTTVPRADGMGRSKKPATKTIRVHADIAFLIDVCAASEGAGRDVPDWVSSLLRPILQNKAAHIQDRVSPHLPNKKKRD